MRHFFRSLSGAPSILLAATLWGTTATARTFAPASASPAAVGAARLVAGGLLLLLIALRGGALRDLAAREARTRGLLAAGAAAVATYQTAFFAATARAGVAVGTVLTIGAVPVFAGLLSWLVSRTSRPDARWLAATAAAVAGCVMLGLGGHASAASGSGIALALLASASYAVYAVTASHLIRHGAEGRAVVGAIFGAAALLLSPVLLISPMRWAAISHGLVVVGYLAVVSTAVPYLLNARGLRTTHVTTATTLGLAEPAVAAVLGLAVLGEHLTAVALAGLGILAASLLILALPARGRLSRSVQAPGPGDPGGPPRTSARKPRAASKDRASARGS